MASARAYHCLCTTLILATNYDLDTLPIRNEPGQDQAKILPLSPEGEHVILSNILHEDRPIVLRREDGFEKRTLLRCKRCNLVLGYQLDQAQFTNEDLQADHVAYILPGALTTTDDMKAGKTADVPQWAQQAA